MYVYKQCIVYIQCKATDCINSDKKSLAGFLTLKKASDSVSYKSY